jgi:hypothetical protein
VLGIDAGGSSLTVEQASEQLDRVHFDVLLVAADDDRHRAQHPTHVDASTRHARNHIQLNQELDEWEKSLAGSPGDRSREELRLPHLA